jgi:hypothetical protein
MSGITRVPLLPQQSRRTGMTIGRAVGAFLFLSSRVLAATGPWAWEWIVVAFAALLDVVTWAGGRHLART